MNANKQVLNEAFKRFQRLPDLPLTTNVKTVELIEESTHVDGSIAHEEVPNQADHFKIVIRKVAESRAYRRPPLRPGLGGR